jgi:prephenate dehydratase
MPIPGSHFKYGFYADMEFDQLKQFESMMKKIESLTNNVKLFGIYKKGKLVKG